MDVVDLVQQACSERDLEQGLVADPEQNACRARFTIFGRGQIASYSNVPLAFQRLPILHEG